MSTSLGPRGMFRAWIVMLISDPLLVFGRRRWWRATVGARFWAAALICGGVLGCSSARDQAPPPPRTSADPSTAAAPLAAEASSATIRAASTRAATEEPPAVATDASAATGVLAAPPAPAVSKIRPADAPYAHFFAALRDLEQGRRKDHVRIAWLGDSHGAADFWSGALRTALQKRFGRGGPGFVHLGYAGYRHDGVKVTTDGKWVMHPKGPATTLVTGDGIFGLGGILFSSDLGAARAQLSVSDPGLTGKLRWDVCYRLDAPDAQLEVALTGMPPSMLKATPEEPPRALRHVMLTSDAGASLAVTPLAGAPQLCGVIVEADPAGKPGMVLDILGINGARLLTPLAWNEASWAAELGRRSPVLVVLEYGTNESGDVNTDPLVYGKHLTDLVARIRKVNPDADCLALSPTDRRDTPSRTPLVREAIRDAARANGCGFWDTYEIMGGKGTMDMWSKENPPRAAKDGVHLTSRGYRELGAKLYDALIERYQL